MIDHMPEAVSAVKSWTSSTWLLPSVNFDFTTAAVVSFVLVLLGLAAGLLLMIRFTNRLARKRGE